MQLDIESTVLEDAASIVVAGEVDVSNADELRDALDAVLEQEPLSIEVDLAQVAYIDSTGIGVLVGAAHRAEEAACRLSVANPQRNVARIMSLLGVDAELNMAHEGREE